MPFNVSLIVVFTETNEFGRDGRGGMGRDAEGRGERGMERGWTRDAEGRGGMGSQWGTHH